MRDGLLRIAAALLVAWPLATPAYTISAGQSLLFNFDLRGEAPAGPYSQVSFQYPNLGSPCCTNLRTTVFGGLDGLGSSGGPFTGLVVAYWGEPVLSEMGDGLFSLRIDAVGEPWSFDGVNAMGVIDAGASTTPWVPGVLAQQSVPEPSSGALLLGAALALGASVTLRRRAQTFG